MDFLILGDGASELGWARRIAGDGRHRLVAAYPGFESIAEAPRALDLDDALATAGIEAVIVGGAFEFRAEALRRVAAAGLPAICLHPPGPDADPYYQVALSREETGTVVVPDLPARLNPGVEALRRALASGELGAFRGIRFESAADAGERDLVRHGFARMVDVVRNLLGEVEAVTATGDPPGEHPTESLTVQLRGTEARHAEIRIWTGAHEPARLAVLGAKGSLILETEPSFGGPARLIRRSSDSPESVVELDPWDPLEAILDVLERAISGIDAHPSLIDATRAMELAEASIRSLRRGRTVELHYEQISAEGSFKSVMTSAGCIVLWCVLIALPAALIGPTFGLGWTLYIAYAIPPILVAFILLQTLRFAVRSRQGGEPAQGHKPNDETGEIKA